MAETVLSFVLDHLSTFLLEEGKLLGGLQQEVQEISNELGHMRAFLTVAETKEEDDPRLQEWIKQVREVAYDTEDVLDEFMFRFGRHRANGFYGCFRRIFNSIKTLQTRHKIASEIQSIKCRIRNISTGHQRYQYEYGTSYQVSGFGALNNTWDCIRDDAIHVEETKLVGIEKPKKLLISHLLNGDSQLKVVSVVGMGGLGKTSLVKSVYEDAFVRKEFQIRAWITVSQTFGVKEILKDLIHQVYEEIKKPVPEVVESMADHKLKTFVRDLLQAKRFAIVFDDVWDLNFWSAIKFALPEGSCGNRVMLTTRIADVASSCIESSGYVYKMEPLSFEESWSLFCIKTFKDNCCPACLKKVAQDILGKCEGLPLAIVTIGGLLALKDKCKIDEWDIVLRSLGDELEGTGKLNRIKHILALSYNDLPSYLKTCLLYISIFPEDYAIDCHQLIQLWIAERFVQRRAEMTMEEVAFGYLKELINRSLIQVAVQRNNREIVTCLIHDLLRDIILSKSRERNMMIIASGEHTNWPEKVRRLVIHNFVNRTPDSDCFNCLRSLIVFGYTGLLTRTSLSELLFGGSRLLKVLDLRGANLKDIPDEVFNLFRLSYLCLRETRVATVPKSIGKLLNLEYLDLGGTDVRELPIEILKVHKLRCLMVLQEGDYPDDYMNYGFKAPYDIGRLLSLHTLMNIDVGKHNILVREIGKLTQLRALGITKLRGQHGKDLSSSLEKLTNLRKLYLTSKDKNEVLDLDHSSFLPLQFLHVLRLWGRLESIPQWLPSSLQGLTRIELLCSGLNVDPLDSLQHLPNLLVIYLNQAYQGEGLCFKAGGFLKLEELFLVNFQGLKWVRVEAGAMPHLQWLHLTNLKLLEELPWGIQHLTELQVLYLDNVSDKLIAKLQSEEEESEGYQQIAHIPEVLIAIWTEDGWIRGPLSYHFTGSHVCQSLAGNNLNIFDGKKVFFERNSLTYNYYGCY